MFTIPTRTKRPKGWAVNQWHLLISPHIFWYEASLLETDPWIKWLFQVEGDVSHKGQYKKRR